MRILPFSSRILLFLLVPFIALTAVSCDDDDPETATISGTITIENADLWETWQDSGEVQVVIFPEFDLDPFPGSGWGEVPDNYYGPGVPGGRFALGAPANAQDPFVLTYVPGKTQYDYSIEVEPGTYSALALGFRHDLITDPAKRTATLGVHWNNPNTVSHGVVIKIPIGGGQILTIFNEPEPVPITVTAGQELDIDFKADFAFVEQWYQ